jgi:hypothetical protein
MMSETKYPFMPGHREALEKHAQARDANGLPTMAALVAENELLRYDKVQAEIERDEARTALQALWDDMDGEEWVVDTETEVLVREALSFRYKLVRFVQGERGIWHGEDVSGLLTYEEARAHQVAMNSGEPGVYYDIKRVTQ